MGILHHEILSTSLVKLPSTSYPTIFWKIFRAAGAEDTLTIAGMELAPEVTQEGQLDS